MRNKRICDEIRMSEDFYRMQRRLGYSEPRGDLTFVSAPAKKKHNPKSEKLEFDVEEELEYMYGYQKNLI